MPYPLLPDSDEEHPIIGRWEAKYAHRDALQRRTLFVAAIAEIEGFEVRLSQTLEGFDIVVRQQP